MCAGALYSDPQVLTVLVDFAGYWTNAFVLFRPM